MIKKKYKVLAGAAVILCGLTAALMFSIRAQPDRERKPETVTQQTKKVLDQIEKDIIELKKEGRIQREKDEIVYIQKDPAEKIGMKL